MFNCIQSLQQMLYDHFVNVITQYQNIPLTTHWWLFILGKNCNLHIKSTIIIRFFFCRLFIPSISGWKYTILCSCYFVCCCILFTTTTGPKSSGMILFAFAYGTYKSSQFHQMFTSVTYLVNRYNQTYMIIG